MQSVVVTYSFSFLIDVVLMANIQRTRSPRREGRKIRKRKQLISSLKSSLSTSYTHFSLSSPSFCSRIFTNLLFGRYSRNKGDPPHVMRSQSLQPELCALDICWDDHTGIVVSSQQREREKKKTKLGEELQMLEVKVKDMNYSGIMFMTLVSCILRRLPLTFDLFFFFERKGKIWTDIDSLYLFVPWSQNFA